MLEILFQLWSFVTDLFWWLMQYIPPLPLERPDGKKREERQNLLAEQYYENECPVAVEATICDKWNTTRTQTFAKQLQMFLKKEMISLKKTCKEETACKSILHVVLCLRQSRLLPDVAYSLTNIEENCYRHVILVLLHFKAEDKKEQAVDLQKSSILYSNITVLDCFLQEKKNNIDEMNIKILEAISSIAMQPQKVHT
ncbi:uncharacterized protein LOC128554841 [Mercenaria mercenaria]|uniref:uncharacterized protein LOC128554841 n=1 Tax=Mercenaria mercenaria TaxID=6596 RepID=UPI00234F1FDC|nr:uncharacterized protein LOC128554841 [Mercenaria mercenaria]